MNDGAILGRNHTDFVAGTLPYEVRLASGNWSPYLPLSEKQSNYKADSMSCVSFSCASVLEIQVKHQTGIEPNYSDRYLAKMSGTTMTGNFLYKVVDTARNIGMVDETAYPMPPSPWTFEQYHADIPEPLNTELLIKAGEWRKTWDVSYEWVDLTVEAFTKHLKHAPLQLVYPNHAIAGVAISISGDTVTYFDTYSPYIKTKKLSEFTDALKIVLTRKQSPMRLVNDNGIFYLEGDKGKIGIADVGALNILKMLTDNVETRASVGREVAVFEKSSASLTLK